MSIRAKARYPYEAKSASELSMKVGDIFPVISKHESGWWVVEIEGKKGVVPGSYCEEITGTPNNLASNRASWNPEASSK
jgi:hypothetical protein